MDLSSRKHELRTAVTSDPAKLVEAMLGDDGMPDEGMPDPKKIALSTHDDSELFEEFMRNYADACRDLYAKAKNSGALSGAEQDGIVIRAVMQIAAKRFWWDQPQYRKLLRNLARFL
jgi:hypothetical protein